jgi:protein-disulfide isomerase
MKKTIINALSAGSLAIALLVGAVATPAMAEISEKDFDKAIERFLKSDAGMEKLGSSMERYFQRKQRDAMKKQEEEAAAELEDQFKNPVKIDAGKSPSTGPKNAKITIIEFSDFQCPYCNRGRTTMEEVMKAYPNDVRVVFKHYPLPFHKDAEPAAKASWAAQQQDKFWEFHDALFKNQDKIGSEFFIQTAKDLKLDIEQFEKDMNSEAAAKQVKEDMEIGAKYGIQGTPGFFVNGVAVKGAYPVSHFKKIIDRWLNKKAAS